MSRSSRCEMIREMKGLFIILIVAFVSHSAYAYRFHVLGASHLPVARHYNACAFTQKIVKLCRILLMYNHSVFLYGAEGSDPDLATAFSQTHSLADIRRDFGDTNYNGSHAIGYEWQGKGEGFRHDFETHVESTKKFYRRAIRAIDARKRDDDFILATLGTHHMPITKKVGLTLTVEPGIGYRGSYARFRAFESNYIQYFTYGSQNPGKGMDGDFYHRVIPNYFELGDFPFAAEPQRARPYYLFLARIIRRKGLWVAIEVCRRLKLRLIIAGQGHRGWFPQNRTLFDQAGSAYQLTEHMDFVGYANATYRSQLMRGATAVFAPTLFLEPFCGVAVESQLSGTPVITTNFGAFTETVEHERTGFRCNTLSEFMMATRLVKRLNRTYIRQRAERLYSSDAVGRQYERWWHDLYHVYESIVSGGELKGWSRMPQWYQEDDDRDDDDDGVRIEEDGDDDDDYRVHIKEEL